MTCVCGSEATHLHTSFWINPDLKRPTLIDSSECSVSHCVQLCRIYSFQQHESHKTIKSAQAQILRLYFPPHKQVFPSSSSPSQPYVSGYLWWRSVLLSGAFAWRCSSSDPLSVPQGQKTRCWSSNTYCKAQLRPFSRFILVKLVSYLYQRLQIYKDGALILTVLWCQNRVQPKKSRLL